MDTLTDRPIDAARVIRRVQHAGAGAVLTFAGTVRNTHLGKDVVAIDYHVYADMAAQELERIRVEAEGLAEGLRVAIVHRTGHLELGEASVLIAVASPHRVAGFEALRYGIDTIKERVPIWKREVYADGTEAWLEGS